MSRCWMTIPLVGPGIRRSSRLATIWISRSKVGSTRFRITCSPKDNTNIKLVNRSPWGASARPLRKPRNIRWRLSTRMGRMWIRHFRINCKRRFKCLRSMCSRFRLLHQESASIPPNYGKVGWFWVTLAAHLETFLSMWQPKPTLTKSM